MNITDFITPFVSYFLFLPSTLLCVAPAKNHLRYSFPRVILRIAIPSLIVSLVLTFISVFYKIDYNLFYFPAFVLVFTMYHKSLTLHFSQSLFLFLLVCAFMTFLSNFSIVFDAYLHPDGLLINFSSTASVFHIGISALFFALVTHPASKYGSFLIDNLPQPRIWWVSSFISGLFFAFNSIMIIHKYSTLHTNKVGSAYLAILLVMFILLILLCIIFYFIVELLVKKAETDDRNRILEMQEKQYESLQNYIDSDAKARHDFRQTIYTIKELSKEGKYQDIDDYLNRYIDTLPQKETVDYCKERSLNALLNHYTALAKQNDIPLILEVSIPEDFSFDTIDLCSIVGNIFENAITACLDVPYKSRFIHIVISEEQGTELYIAAANSFNGVVKEKDGHYRSTHKGGNGIGLISVTATAAKYNGTTRFRHTSSVFYSDVMLKNKITE